MKTNKGTIRINNADVPTLRCDFAASSSCLSVNAGTNGFSGSPYRDGGSRAYLQLTCKNGDYRFVPVTDKQGNIVGIEVACCGDEAIATLIESLWFVTDALVDSARRFEK